MYFFHLKTLNYIIFQLTSFLRIILSLDNLPIDLMVQINKLIKQLAKNWCFHQEGFIQITQLVCGKNVYSYYNKYNVTFIGISIGIILMLIHFRCTLYYH